MSGLVINSQVQRLFVFTYILTDDQYHQANVAETLHRWDQTSVGGSMLDFFKIFTKKLNAFFDGHGITDAVLNYGPMFEGEIYMSLEKYITPIPDQFINKLITLNLTEDELAFINSSAPLFQVGFVLSEFLPQAIVTYNPEAVDIQSGVDVYPATPVAPAAPTAPTTTVVVPPWLLSQSTPAAASATTAAPNPNPPSVNQTQYGGKKLRYTNRRRRNHRKATRKH